MEPAIRGARPQSGITSTVRHFELRWPRKSHLRLRTRSEFAPEPTAANLTHYAAVAADGVTPTLNSAKSGKTALDPYVGLATGGRSLAAASLVHRWSSPSAPVAASPRSGANSVNRAGLPEKVVHPRKLATGAFRPRRFFQFEHGIQGRSSRSHRGLGGERGRNGTAERTIGVNDDEAF
jgi:hypothetical protein